jgi:alkyl hydroperoxide reductase subunit AhpC
MIEQGTQAPDFTLTSDSGEAVTLSKLRGSPVVLYFYPRDDTLPTKFTLGRVSPARAKRETRPPAAVSALVQGS